MTSWLESKAPIRFTDLLVNDSVKETLQTASTGSNPPHLLLSGPSGVGKTAVMRMVARQLLGPGWQSTTHILNAKDLSRMAGAMKIFEEFIRPSGSGNSLAGLTSLDIFTDSLAEVPDDVGPPSGQETFNLDSDGRVKLSRIIVIEDADYLGNLRQAYLRRMMEQSSLTSRFIFTTTTPSRLIEALRSRVQHIRLSRYDNKLIEQSLTRIVNEENLQPARGMIGDIAHVSEGNIRKAIFLLELLSKRDLLTDRRNLLNLVSSTKVREIQQVLEEAMRGRVHDWRWEKTNGRNMRTLKGAMGMLDQLMEQKNFEAEDIVNQFHKLLTEGRMNLDDVLLAKIMISLANCEVSVYKTSQPRIELERFLLDVASYSAT
ncbi:MAG: AAA family ATPase [Candidatus Thermoplasmatota archaeon]|nr:AAA family ATPase [Candidatus Thermoplasmatota archaeon]MEC8312711.1 AAA family ATPase [Candidatus Thermoplasmatota archaeon]